MKGALATLAMVLAASPPTVSQAWPIGTFKYVIDHEERGRIGIQKVTFRQQGRDLVVDVDVQVLVKLLFVTVYVYASKRRELWHEDHLVAYDALTNDNGKEIKVSARAKGSDMVIRGPEGHVAIPGTVFPTHAWHPDTVNQKTLMDSESGKLLKVSIEPAGQERIDVRGRTITTRKYVMSGELERELWYDETGLWVRTRFQSGGVDVTLTLD